MARKSSGRPWPHGASGWWCTTLNGKRKKLDKDYRVACRKLKELRARQKREEAGDREWLGGSFAILADEYQADINADFHGRKIINAFTSLGGLRESEDDRQIVQPRDGSRFPIEGRLTEDRIVAALVEMHDNAVLLNLDAA